MPILLQKSANFYRMFVTQFDCNLYLARFAELTKEPIFNLSWPPLHSL
jgi:hypothetical protein